MRIFVCVVQFALVLCTVCGAAAEERVPVTDVCERYNLAVVSESATSLVYKTGSQIMVLVPDSRAIRFNNVLLWLNSPVIKNDGRWTISTSDVGVVVGPLLSPEKTMASAGARSGRVVLDAGHGGDDSGARGVSAAVEKDLVLDITKRSARRLRENNVAVALTRGKDNTIELIDRTKKTKVLKGDLFVSIHLNSASNASAVGLETYVLPAEGYPSTAMGRGNNAGVAGNREDALNTLLGYYVHGAVMKSLKCLDRGIKRARFDVLASSPCPAVLVECGFVSHSEEEKNLLNCEYRELIAEGLANGILEYLNHAASAGAETNGGRTGRGQEKNGSPATIRR